MLEILGGKLHDLWFLDRFGNGINKMLANYWENFSSSYSYRSFTHLVLNFQILITYLDELVICQVRYQSFNSEHVYDTEF
jgi:hypothetical protein